MDWALILTIAKVGIPLVLMGLLPVVILMERRGAAYIQDRPGPNRAAVNLGLRAWSGWQLFRRLQPVVNTFMRQLM